MTKNKGRVSKIYNLSVHKDSQPEVLPILERLRKPDMGISRTICRLLIQLKNDNYELRDDSLSIKKIDPDNSLIG